MPIDGTAPAYPIPLGENDLGKLTPLDLGDGDAAYAPSSGMTKRETFACTIMAPLAARHPGRDADALARTAVDLADALIKAL